MIDNSVRRQAQGIPAISTDKTDVRSMSKEFEPSDMSDRLHVVAKKVTFRKKKAICSALNCYRTAEATAKLTAALFF